MRLKYLETRELIEESSPFDKIKVCLLYVDRLIHLKGEKVAIMEMRKHAAWYLKGLKRNGKVRSKINYIDTREALQEILYDYAYQLEGNVKIS